MKKLLITCLMVLSFNCFAGEEQGTVRFQHGQYGANSTSPGKMFFFLEGNSKINSPACATNANGERWVIDNNWPAAQIQLSILLAAQLSGKQVYIRGSNNCEVFDNTETALDIYIR